MPAPPHHNPKILIVDDDEGLLLLMAEALRSEGYEVATARSGAAALQSLAGGKPDLMLLDLKMKDMGGTTLIKRVQEDSDHVPFIVVTGQGDEKVAVEVMKRGALDYVMKDGGLLDLLPPVVKRALASSERERALSAAQAESRRLEREILAASERERQTIGADLHDGLGQQLTAIELHCAGLKWDLASAMPDLAMRVDRISQLLREAIAQTRSLARGLVPVGSGPDALQTGLADLAERASALGKARCRLICPAPIEIRDRFAAGQLYRIAQEALNNAIKHASADLVTIRLEKKSGAVELSISDDGRGLPATRNRRGGLGLGMMGQRAEGIGAKFSVSSEPGRGVTVTCVYPESP